MPKITDAIVSKIYQDFNHHFGLDCTLSGEYNRRDWDED